MIIKRDLTSTWITVSRAVLYSTYCTFEFWILNFDFKREAIYSIHYCRWNHAARHPHTSWFAIGYIYVYYRISKSSSLLCSLIYFVFALFYVSILNHPMRFYTTWEETTYSLSSKKIIAFLACLLYRTYWIIGFISSTIYHRRGQ